MDKFITSDKIFYHLDRLNSWKNNEVVRPITFEIHPTNLCNNDCYYCGSKKTRDSKSMSRQELKICINKLKELRLRGIIFSGGGEPLCNVNTIDSVIEAKKQGLSVGFITNGTLIDEKVANSLVENCEWIRISLDTINEETYKKIRGTDDLNKAKKGLASLLKSKERNNPRCTIGVQIVVNDHNYKEIYGFVEHLHKSFREIDYIQIRPIEIKKDEIPYNKEQISRIKEELELIKKKKEIDNAIISVKWDLIFGTREYGFFACHCYPLIGAVDAYGDIYICCHTIKQPGFKYGNIFNDDVDNILNKRELIAEKTIKNQLSGLCPVGCRGSTINRRLEGLKRGRNHKNFL